MYKAQLGPYANIDAVELLVKDQKLLVGCSNGTIELLELQFPGKKRMDVETFLTGNTIEGILK